MPFTMFLFSGGSGSPPALLELDQNKYQFLRSLQLPGNTLGLIGKNLIFNGNATITDGQFGESISLDGTAGTFVEIQDSSDFDLDDDDFAISLRVKVNGNLSGFSPIFAKWDSDSAPKSFLISETGSGGTPANSFAFSWSADNTFNSSRNIYSSAFTIGQWYHLLCVRRGTQFEFIVDGISQGTVDNGAITLNPLPNFLYLGFSDATVSPPYFNGEMEDVFIIKGTSLVGVNEPAIPYLTPTAETSPPKDYDPTLNSITCQLSGKHLNDYYGGVQPTSNNSKDDLFKVRLGTSGAQLPTIDTVITKFAGNPVINFGGSATQQFLTLNNENGNFTVGTNDFTFEFWLYINSIESGGGNDSDTFIDYRPDNTNGASIGIVGIFPASTQVLRWALIGGTGSINGSVLSTSTWYYVRCSKSGTTAEMWLDGVSEGTAVVPSNISLNSVLVKIGANAFRGIAPDTYGNIKITDYRFFNGIALQGDFTPPQVPLYNPQKEPVASDRVKTVFWLNADDENNTSDKIGNSLTLAGDVSNIAQPWFYGSRAYDFDGIGDEITSPDKLEWEFDRTSGYTVECWFNVDSHTANRRDLVKHGTNWSLGINNSDQLSFIYDNGATQEVSDSTALSTNRDYHAEISYDGTNLTLRLNGNQVATATVAGTPTDVSSTLTLGTNLNGQIFEVKVAETNKYSKAFSIYPDNPSQTDHYSTDLLIQADDTYGAGFNWDRTGKDLSSTNTTVTVDSDFFYGEGTDFNGTDSEIAITDKPPNYDGDFAIELEVKEDNQVGSKDLFEGDNWLLTLNGTTLQLESPLATTLISTTVASGTKRVFVGRRDGQLQMAVDDTFVTPVADTTNLQHSTSLKIGGGSAGNPFDGKLSSIRMKHAYLEPSWTQPPPIASDPYINDVVFLIPCIGIASSTSFPELKGKTVTANGNAQISTSQSNYNNSSCILDGTGDYLSLANTSEFDFGTGSLTLEGYWYFTNLSGSPNNYLYSFGTNWDVHVTSSGSLVLFDGSTIASTGNIISTATWYHIRIVKDGGTAYLFVDGTQQASGAWTTASTPTGVLTIGGLSASGYTTGHNQWHRLTDVARNSESFPLLTQPFPLR